MNRTHWSMRLLVPPFIKAIMPFPLLTPQAAQDDAALDKLLDKIMASAISPGAIQKATQSYIADIM